MNQDHINDALEEADKIQESIEKQKASSYKKASTRSDLIIELNEILEENDAESEIVDGSEKFKDLGLDSFGATMFFLELDDRYQYFGESKSKEDFFKGIDWNKITANDIINKILCT